MKANECIISFLRKMVNKFPSLEFKGEYNESISTFIILVTPNDEYEGNDEYREEELDFSLNFSIEFPDQDIVFVSEESIVKVNHPHPLLSAKNATGIVKCFETQNNTINALFHNRVEEGYNDNSSEYASAA